MLGREEGELKREEEGEEGQLVAPSFFSFSSSLPSLFCSAQQEHHIQKSEKNIDLVG